MGKNHRHKKKLKSEKAKVHITTKTKFLPKGQNVTNTSFKIKPIVIREQLKDKANDDEQLQSRKKQNINEIITKLRHFNDTIKVEACEDLINMLHKYPVELFHVHLSSLIQNAAQLIQDREKKVRRACVKLITQILQKVQLVKLEPFFLYISANLRCAMTNIERTIQEDSLLILDSLLEYVPTLTSKNFDKIFPDFLTLISKSRHDSSSERTLTMNLGRKVTSVKWRIKVLSRLHGILNSIIIKNEEDNMSRNNTTEDVNLKNAEGLYYIPIYKNDFLSEENCINNTEANNQNYLHKNTSDILKMHIGTLVPLLYETWLEVVPENSIKKSLNDTTILNEESAAILCCVVKILHMLYQYSILTNLESVFPRKETAQFLDYLVSNFPYSQNKRQKQDSIIKEIAKVFTSHSDPKCIQENLLVAYLFFTLKVTNPSKLFKQKVNKILNYINQYLITCNQNNLKQLPIVIEILKEVLLNDRKYWRMFGVNHIEVLENLIVFYGKVSEDVKPTVLDILTLSTSTFKCDKFENWLLNLPKELCAPQISSEVIKVLLTLSRENCEVIHKGLSDNFSDILNNLPNQDKLNENMKKNLVQIFFYSPNLDQTQLKILHEFIKNNPHNSYSKYFEELIEWRAILQR